MQLSTFQTVHILQKCPGIILLFPPAQIWSDSGNTLCYFNGVRQGKGGDRFSLKLVNESEWVWLKFPRLTSACSYIFNTYSHALNQVFTARNFSLQIFFQFLFQRLTTEAPSKTSWLPVCLCACAASVWLSFESSLTSGEKGSNNMRLDFILANCLSV